MNAAQFVAIGAALLALMCSVFCAFAWWKASNTATKLRSMSSTLAELAEIRDYLQKIDAWSKRINSRLVMQNRKLGDQGELPMSQETDKEALRRRVGLTAGRPAPHRDN